MSRARVYKLAAKVGAEVRINNDATGNLDVEVVAPSGHHWDSGVHALVCAQDVGEPAADVWRDLLDRMHEGLFPCSERCKAT